MPIGKNSLKRVANNGYSNVKTAAPDMENSTEIKESVKEVKKKAPAKKASAQAAVKKTSESVPKVKKEAEKEAIVSEKKKAIVSEKKKAIVSEKKEALSPISGGAEKPQYVNIGRDMPSYLL